MYSQVLLILTEEDSLYRVCGPGSKNLEAILAFCLPLAVVEVFLLWLLIAIRLRVGCG